MNRLCTHGKAFEAVVTQSKGWQMVNEGDEIKPKFGYVTTQVHNSHTPSGLDDAAEQWAPTHSPARAVQQLCSHC